MRFRQMIRCALLATLLLGDISAQAQTPPASPPEIEYGYPDQSIFPVWRDGGGHIDGPLIRLAGALFHQAGMKWHGTAYPAPRLFKNLHDGITNFSMLVRSQPLEECCILSQKPVYGTDLNIYFIGNKAPIKSKEGLIGKHIITVRGYSYGGLLKFIEDPANHARIEVAGTHQAAFAMLSSGRGDYVLDYATAVEDMLESEPIPGLRTYAIDYLGVYMALSKTYPDAGKVMERLEKAYESLDKKAVFSRPAKPVR